MFQETMEAMRIMGIPEEEQMGTRLALLWVRGGRQETGHHSLRGTGAAERPGEGFLSALTPRESCRGPEEGLECTGSSASHVRFRVICSQCYHRHFCTGEQRTGA